MAEAPAKAPPAGNLRRFGLPWTQGCWHTGRKLNYICSMMLDIIPRRHSIVTRSRCLPRALNAAVPGLGAALGLWAMPHLGPGCESPREDHRSKASSRRGGPWMQRTAVDDGERPTRVPTQLQAEGEIAVTCSDWQCAAKLKITRKSGMGLLSSPHSRQETAPLHGACSARGIWNIKFAPRTPLVPRPALEAASPTGSLSARAILTRSSRLEACRPAIGRSDVPQSGQSGRPVPSMMCTCIQIYRLVL